MKSEKVWDWLAVVEFVQRIASDWLGVDVLRLFHEHTFYE